LHGSDDEKLECKQLEVNLLNNSSMINLKINEYSKVIENCDKILEGNKKENHPALDTNNVKALFRRGCA